MAHKITAESKELVLNLASAGVTQDAVASALKVSVDTLARRYRRELDEGSGVAVGRVARRLNEIALGPDLRAAVPACIFLLKTRGGFSQAPEVQVNVNNQAVSAPQAVAKLSPANEEALAALIASARDRVRLPS